MYYEVYIPTHQADGFDTTITVEADNWMTALKSGLERTGEGAEAMRNVMCDIKDDNTIHVTDATTRRVFVLKQVDEVSEASAELLTERIDVSSLKPPETPAPIVEPKSQVQSDSSERRKTTPLDEGVSSTPQQVAKTPLPLTPAPKPPELKAPVLKAPELKPPTPKPPTPKPPTPKPPTPKPPIPKPQAPEPAAVAPKSEPLPTFEAEPAGLGSQDSWTSDDGRMSIGSATYEALGRDTEKPRVVSETRAPSGTRPAVELERADDNVSQSIMEEVFLEIQQIFERDMSMEDVINFTMDLAMEKIKAEAGSIMFADLSGTELYFATARGPKAKDIMEFRVPMGKGIVGFCVREGVSLAIGDVEKDPRFYKTISEKVGYATKNLACAPVQHEGRVFGAIQLMNKERQFASVEVNVLGYIGMQLAKFIFDLIMAKEKIE